MDLIFEGVAAIKPKGEPRPRTRVMGRNAVIYTPPAAKVYRQTLAALLAWSGSPAVQPGRAAALWVRFTFARPKSHFRASGELREDASEYHIQKPDADNLEKAVKDTITHMGVWPDDSCVVSVSKCKRWGIEDRIELRIWQV